MIYLNSKLSTVGIFFAASTLLIIYLLSIRYNIYLPVALFWVAITLMLSTITYQCLQLKLSPDYAKVVLSEIAVTCLVFHLIYQVPFYGPYGLDAYRDTGAANSILSSGFVMGDPKGINLPTAFYPIIHIIGAQLSLITNTELFLIVKWFPPLLDVALIFLLYLLIRSIFKEERITLLTVLLFTCLQQHVLFSSLFIKQTIALTLAVCCIYLYFSAKSSQHPVIYSVLSIICLVGTIFAHHLTSFMLFVFLLIHFLLTRAYELPLLRRIYVGYNTTGIKITISFLSIAFVVLLTHWMYVHDAPIIALVEFTRGILIPSQWGLPSYADIANIGAASILTVRGYIIFYGFQFFLLGFGIILLIGILPRLKHPRIEALSFTLFMFLCGILGLITLWLIPFGSAPFPDRFIVFGWLFGFAPLLVTILTVKYQSFRRICILLLFAFMLFNIYMIEPQNWDARSEEIPNAAIEEDYALANTFDFSQGSIAGSPYTVMAIYTVHANYGIPILAGELPDFNLVEFDWFIVHKEILRMDLMYYPTPRNKITAQTEQLVKGETPGQNKVYESKNLSVFQLE